MTDLATCRWCDVEIRREEVLVGPPPGRLVTLWVDVDAHPDGVVIERDDGEFRRLLADQTSKTVKPLFRIHGKRTCGPDGPGNPEQ